MNPIDKLRLDEELRLAETARRPSGTSAYVIAYRIFVGTLGAVTVMLIIIASLKIFSVSTQSQATTSHLGTVNTAVDALNARQVYAIATFSRAICQHDQNEFQWFLGIDAVERRYYPHPKPGTLQGDRRPLFDERRKREGNSFDLEKCISQYVNAGIKVATPPPAMTSP